jgi:hypothetical protein
VGRLAAAVRASVAVGDVGVSELGDEQGVVGHVDLLGALWTGTYDATEKTARAERQEGRASTLRRDDLLLTVLARCECPATTD